MPDQAAIDAFINALLGENRFKQPIPKEPSAEGTYIHDFVQNLKRNQTQQPTYTPPEDTEFGQLIRKSRQASAAAKNDPNWNGEAARRALAAEEDRKRRIIALIKAQSMGVPVPNGLAPQMQPPFKGAGTVWESLFKAQPSPDPGFRLKPGMLR